MDQHISPLLLPQPLQAIDIGSTESNMDSLTFKEKVLMLLTSFVVIALICIGSAILLDPHTKHHRHK